MIFQMGRASSTTNQQFDLEILIYGPWGVNVGYLSFPSTLVGSQRF